MFSHASPDSHQFDFNLDWRCFLIGSCVQQWNASTPLFCQHFIFINDKAFMLALLLRTMLRHYGLLPIKLNDHWHIA